MTAIAHQDASPQANNGSNTKPFNRELAKISAQVFGIEPEQAEQAIARVFGHFPIYPSTTQLLELATGAELLAACFVAQYPMHFGGTDGQGLFSGVGRYEMLSKKLQDAATFNLRLSSLYQSLTELLCLSNYYPESQLIFATLPTPIQSAVSVACLKNPQFVVAIARQVSDAALDAKRKEKKNVLEELTTYRPTEEQVLQLTQQQSDKLIMAIPCLSGNALGHQLRSAIALDMMERLELTPEMLPIGSRYLMFHGGQRCKGVVTPGDADLLEAQLRNLYPGLDAMGGCCDGFLMGKSQLNLQAHILCAENNWITDQIAGITEQRSVFEMLDIVTMTRGGMGGTSKDDGQMIFSHETLCKGTEAIMRLQFEPHTAQKTIGAVIAGIDYWQRREGVFGGKSARNFGRFMIETLEGDGPSEDVYDDWVKGNREAMIDGLRSGMFGTKKVLCAAGLEAVAE